MKQEIERKFLVTADSWRRGAAGVPYRQGYLVADATRSVRVRLAGERAFLTIKGPRKGAARAELEYTIPVDDAEMMLDELCQGPLIEKIRYRLEWAGHDWEVDEFRGDNSGLVVAEIELDHEDEPFERPPWLGEEVTDDPRYLNANLVRHPFRRW